MPSSGVVGTTAQTASRFSPAASSLCPQSSLHTAVTHGSRVCLCCSDTRPASHPVFHSHWKIKEDAGRDMIVFLLETGVQLRLSSPLSCGCPKNGPLPQHHEFEIIKINK